MVKATGVSGLWGQQYKLSRSPAEQAERRAKREERRRKRQVREVRAMNTRHVCGSVPTPLCGACRFEERV